MNQTPVVLYASVLMFACGLCHGEPGLQVVADEQPAYPGRPYRIVCEVHWVGEPDEYAVLPADVEHIDWGGVRLLEVRATRRDDANVVTQTIEITPYQAGEFMTPGISIAYLSPEYHEWPEQPGPPTHPTAPEASPQLRAEPFALRVRPDRTLAWLSGALGALFLCAAAAWLTVRRRRRRQPAVAETETDLAAVRTALDTATQRRMHGDYYAFYGQLLRAAQLLTPDDGRTLDALKARAEQAGYGGARPADDQMDAEFRALERALEKRNEELLS